MKRRSLRRGDIRGLRRPRIAGHTTLSTVLILALVAWVVNDCDSADETETGNVNVEVVYDSQITDGPKHDPEHMDQIVDRVFCRVTQGQTVNLEGNFVDRGGFYEVEISLRGSQTYDIEATAFHQDIAVFVGSTEIWVRAGATSAATIHLHSLPPVAPSDLAGTPVSSSHNSLTWRDNSVNEEGFTIQRKISGESAWQDAGRTSQDVLSYSDDHCQPNTAYVYRIVAFNSAGLSGPSNEWWATTINLDSPTNARAEAFGSNLINVFWTDQSSNELGFLIERSVGSPGNWEFLGDTGQDAGQYADDQCLPRTTYYYRIRASNDAGQSGYTNETSATSWNLTPPTNLAAEGVWTTQINLTWVDNSNNETAFHIYRKDEGDTSEYGLAVGGTAPNTQIFPDYTCAPNASYVYRVVAVNEYDAPAWSGEATARTWVIEPPTHVLATRTGSTQVRLTWQDNSSGEYGFLIYRLLEPYGNWTFHANVGENAEEYIDEWILPQPEIWYCYRIRSIGVNGESPESAESCCSP